MLKEEKINATTMANVVSSFAPDYMLQDGTMDGEFEQFVKSLISDARMRVLILNPDSVVVFDSQHNINLINRAQIKSSVLTAVGGKTGYSEYVSDKGINMLDAAAPIMRDGKVKSEAKRS